MTATGNEAVTLAQLRTATGSTGSGGATGGEAVTIAQVAQALGATPTGTPDVGRLAIRLSQLKRASEARSVTLKNLLSNNGYGYPRATNEGFATTNWARYPLPPGDSVQRCLWLVPSANRPESFRNINNVGAGLVPSHVYYFTFKVYYPGSTVNGSFDFYWPVAEPPGMSDAKATKTKTWTKLSAVFDRRAHSGSSGSRQARWDYNCNNKTDGINVTSFMLIDLTEAFGAGREPSKAYCDARIPWFDDTLTLDLVTLAGD